MQISFPVSRILWRDKWELISLHSLANRFSFHSSYEHTALQRTPAFVAKLCRNFHTDGADVKWRDANFSLINQITRKEMQQYMMQWLENITELLTLTCNQINNESLFMTSKLNGFYWCDVINCVSLDIPTDSCLFTLQPEPWASW